jgi:TolB-like protein/DNA-binding winged helix-turn-helix (wHTH) protein/tetratricopeptide (TPR) repeat protein
MEHSAGPARVLRFGTFDVDVRTGELRRQGLKVRLQEQPFQILAELLERPGELVTRDELCQKLWPGDVFVDFDQGLNNAVKKLRLALGDDAENPRFVETVARRGYRFIASVEEVAGPQPAAGLGRSRQRWAGALALTAVLLGAVFLVRPRLSSSVPAGTIRLAVLPFDNLSGDPSQQYFSDGMTAEMIVQLGLLHPERLAVLARTTAERYRGTTKSTREIGRELEVDYILEGTVRRAAGQVRVTAALVRTRDEVQLWTASFDRESKDMLELQAEVARSVARGIPIELTPAERARLASARPVDPEAHEAYLEGLYFWSKFSPDAAPKAVEHFQRAIARDPGYAAAHAGLASAYALLAVFDISPPRDAYPKSKGAAVRALQIDVNEADAHDALGWAAFIFDWDFPAAEREFTRAIALDRNSAEAYHGYGMYLAAMGRSDSSLAAIRRARELDPLSLHINHKLCAVLYWARQYDAAIAQCRRTLEIEPTFGPAHWHLAHAYDAKGMHDEAQEEYFLAHEYIGGDVEQIRRDRAAVKAAGWRPILRQGVDGWSKALKSSKNPREAEEAAYIVAWMYARLGETDPTLEWLERGYEARPFFLPFIGVEPLFDPMRSDPRFQDLLRRIGLPQAQTSPKT